MRLRVRIKKGRYALIVFGDLCAHQARLLSDRTQRTRDGVDRLVLLLDHHLQLQRSPFRRRISGEGLTCCSCRAHLA